MASKHVVIETEEDIAAAVESGYYFELARKWYNQKYLSVITQRTALIVISLLSALSALSLFFTINSFFPLNAKIPFSTWSPDVNQYYASLHTLAKENNKTEPLNRAIARQYLSFYIEQYEGYSKGGIATNANRSSVLNTLSSLRVYRQYEQSHNARSPDSPYFKVGPTGERQVKIISVTFPPDQVRVAKARVIFSTQDVTRAGKMKEQFFRADVDFSLSDVDVMAHQKNNAGAEIKFNVTGYDVKPVRY